MYVEEIIEQIPQVSPFRFCSDIINLEENKCVTRLDITGKEFFFKGHFPHNPIMPGCLLVETMAQSAEVIFLSQQKVKKSMRKAYLVQIKDVKFYAPIAPPSSLFITTTITKHLGAMSEIKSEVYDCEKRLVAKGTMYLYCEFEESERVD